MGAQNRVQNIKVHFIVNYIILLHSNEAGNNRKYCTV
jgi:hypothetical protein